MAIYESRKKVFWFAITSRLTVILLQFVFNALCPDHAADAFRTPLNPSEEISVLNKAVDCLLGGLTRWDAQYFMHIAKYGYTYENTLAFFPLYPMSVRCLADILKFVTFANINEHSLITIASVLINFACFVKSAVIFYDLSKHVFGPTSTAYKAAILYCINPASIFFTAGYSESMFAYLTFYSMLVSLRHHRFSYLPIGLSTLVRSNGLINIGFPVYDWLVQNFIFHVVSKIVQQWNNLSVIKVFRLVLTETLLRSFGILNTIFLSLIPYFFLQVYNYVLFCTEYSRNTSTIPVHVERYAKENNLILAGSVDKIPWCNASVPLAYSTIQNKYWNVGFMKYYQLKQIPNFMLAFPILWIMLKCVRQYYVDHVNSLSLVVVGRKFEKTAQNDRANQLPAGMFVFVVHGLFLTIFCIFFVHIQVSTRLLASASPLLYWYCASKMSYEPTNCENKSFNNYEDHENTLSKWKVFFMTQNKYTMADRWILIYFVGYLVVGCFMYSNFLPWT